MTKWSVSLKRPKVMRTVQSLFTKMGEEVTVNPSSILFIYTE